METASAARPYVVGVGAANLDIHGRPKKAIVMHDSNPGHMNASAGGVTRNVCDNLARLGADVRLISAVGTDLYADVIRQECTAAGIDVSQLCVAPGCASSTYLSILDEHGDMLVALSDMTVLQEHLTPEFLDSRAELLQNAAIVTCDPCLTERTLLHLLDLCEGRTPVYVDPVSTAYARVLAPHIGRFHTAKPNVLELSILSGREITDEASLEAAGASLLDKGLERLLVSLGKDGCLYMDRSGTVLRRKLRPVEQMVNATGAGDAFMAAVIYSTLSGFDPEKRFTMLWRPGSPPFPTREPFIPVCVYHSLKKSGRSINYEQSA